MTDIRPIQILPFYQSKEFDKPPHLSPQGKKVFFVIEEAIKPILANNIRSDINKVGFILQLGYFKACGRFFASDMYDKEDIKFVTQLLDLKIRTINLKDYHNRTRLAHKSLILNLQNFSTFTDKEEFFEEAAKSMVARQMNPKKILYSLIDLLRNSRIEIPDYSKFVTTISQHFYVFEQELVSKVKQILSPPFIEIISELMGRSNDNNLLTKLKVINHSLRPNKIKQSLSNFLIIKKLYNETKWLLEQINITPEAISYYAKWVIKAKSSQIKEITEVSKRCLYLTCFIAHQFKFMQDNFIDVLLKSMQQQLNKAEDKGNEQIITNNAEKTLLTESVLGEYNNLKHKFESIRDIVYSQSTTDQAKLEKIKVIIPQEASNNTNEADLQKLTTKVKEEKEKADFYWSLAELSRKMQNRVSDIIRYLEFTVHDSIPDLKKAIEFYQQNKRITELAPCEFLDSIEYKAVHKAGFNVSLYKAILFSKMVYAIRSGSVSLKYSYRYMPIDSYLLGAEYWDQDKDAILAKTGLAKFKNIDSLLQDLEGELDNNFYQVNERIKSGKNKHIKIKQDGGFSVYTPAVDKPDYKPIAEIISKGSYVPILQIMSEVNLVTQFTENFRHYKIKGSNKPPTASTFLAGIFSLGSNINLHKLANTSIGINYNQLTHTVNWYFSLDNLYAVNSAITAYMNKMWLPNKFKKEQRLLHTSSDARKRAVSVESLNANYSYKYLGHSKGSNVYIFIDERGIVFFTTVFSSSDRDAPYVIDGLLHDQETIKSDMHSTDTHGYTEIIFAVSYLIGVYFAPRIKDIASQQLVSFGKIRNDLKGKDYVIQPSKYVSLKVIKDNWDYVLRLIATIKLGDCKASVILKRLGSFSKQHPLKEALKEFGRIIKSSFLLKYINEVTLRQTVEKQLNKGELANKFSSALSFTNDEILQSDREEQEKAALCKTIIQNIIILWNYIELTRIILGLGEDERKKILEHVINGSIMIWQYINFLGTYNFRNLVRKNRYLKLGDEMFYYRAA